MHLVRRGGEHEVGIAAPERGLVRRDGRQTALAAVRGHAEGDLRQSVGDDGEILEQRYPHGGNLGAVESRGQAMGQVERQGVLRLLQEGVQRLAGGWMHARRMRFAPAAVHDAVGRERGRWNRLRANSGPLPEQRGRRPSLVRGVAHDEVVAPSGVEIDTEIGSRARPAVASGVDLDAHVAVGACEEPVASGGGHPQRAGPDDIVMIGGQAGCGGAVAPVEADLGIGAHQQRLLLLRAAVVDGAEPLIRRPAGVGLAAAEGEGGAAHGRQVEVGDNRAGQVVDQFMHQGQEDLARDEVAGGRIDGRRPLENPPLAEGLVGQQRQAIEEAGTDTRAGRGLGGGPVADKAGAGEVARGRQGLQRGVDDGERVDHDRGVIRRGQPRVTERQRHDRMLLRSLPAVVEAGVAAGPVEREQAAAALDELQEARGGIGGDARNIGQDDGGERVQALARDELGQREQLRHYKTRRRSRCLCSRRSRNGLARGRAVEE